MQLFCEIGLLSATLLVVGNIIGIGAFTTTGFIAAEIGNSPWLLGVWILFRLLPGLFVFINGVVLVSAAVSNPKEALVGGMVNSPHFSHPVYCIGAMLRSDRVSRRSGVRKAD